MNSPATRLDYADLAENIRQWASDLGFQQLGISDTRLTQYEQRLEHWLAQGYHGDMHYMQAHGRKRSRPSRLIDGTLRVISVRMDYLPPSARDMETVLNDPELGYISRYALGRDYHKVMRKRLQRLVDQIKTATSDAHFRVFVDSAPVLEKAVAEKAGLGWIGKHTNVINKNTGSWFFLGEIYTNLPLPVDQAEAESHCGNCRACIDICPTRAIIAPYQLDARRCISYLTIELKGSIPVEFRHAIGNRIYGCDDCQLVCPWNRFAQLSRETDFSVRHGLDAPRLLELFAWSEATFDKNTEGSAMRRIGYPQWQRNIAVALGNAPASTQIIRALEQQRVGAGDMVREHIDWALAQQKQGLSDTRAS